MSEVDATPWTETSSNIDLFYALIEQRNRRETPQYVCALHESNAALQNVADTVRGKYDVLKRENNELKLQLMEVNKGSADGNSKMEKRLRDKVQELQDRLNSCLEKDVAETARQLESTKEMSRLKELSYKHEKDIDDLMQEKTKLETKVADMKISLEKSELKSSYAEKHCNAFKEEMTTLQNENLALKTENMQLVTRLVTEKENMMSQFNTMNELNDSLNKEIVVLRDLLKDERAKSSSRESLFSGRSSDVQKGNQIDGGRMWGNSGKTVLPSSPLYVVKGAHSCEATSVCYDQSGSNIVATASSDSTVKLWDTSNGLLKCSLYGTSGQPMMGVDISGDLIAGCSSDKTCRIWKRNERLVHHLTGHSSKVTCCRIFPDNKRVISGSADRSIRLWEIDRRTYKQTTTLRHGSTPYCIDLSSDASTAVSGHLDGGLRFWDLRSGDRVAEIRDLHENGVTSVRCSPMDGTKLLTNGRDSCLKIVDVRTADTVQVFSHEGFRTTFNWSSSSWSPDGKI